MSNGKHYIIPPAPQAALAVRRIERPVSVRRIWCVGRNYSEHIKEMGQDEREPPFFFAKPPTPSCGWRHVALSLADKDMHHEVEMVVALKSGGRAIAVEQGARLRVGLRRRHRP